MLYYLKRMQTLWFKLAKLETIQDCRKKKRESYHSGFSSSSINTCFFSFWYHWMKILPISVIQHPFIFYFSALAGARNFVFAATYRQATRSTQLSLLQC